jgi:CPA1 family monovalent cation:H+ antiporter
MALSIPLLANGKPFPYRDLILFITFIVILVTLVFQGLTFPWLIRKVNLEDRYALIPEEKQEVIIQKKMALYSLEYLEEKFGPGWNQNERLKNLQSRFKIDLKLLTEELENKDTKDRTLRDFQQVYLQLLEHQRKKLTEMNHRAEFDEDLIRKYLSLIDLEEFKLREKILVD